MSTDALVFMLVSWAFVLGLTAWSFHRLLSGKRTTAAADAEAPPGAPALGVEPSR